MKNRRIQETFSCCFCSFVSSAKTSHNQIIPLKRHMKIFHPEILTETVHQNKTESISALSVQEDAISDVEEETYNEKPSVDESSLAKKMNDLNELLDEEGRDEDEEKRNPLLLAWKRERVKENWSKVRNCMRDFIV